MRIIDNTNPKFLYSIINSNQSYFKMMGEGSSQLNISKSHVEDFTVDIPNLDEQKRVSNLLLILEQLINLHQRKLNNLNKLKQGLLQQMFV